MTLRDFLTQSGYIRPGATKARCPFHDDSSPSAMVHDDNNTMWCYACRKNFGPQDFFASFGVVFDEVSDPSALLASAHEWGEVLFFHTEQR